MRDRRGGLALLCALLLAMIVFPAPARMVSSTLVISQVYGGGGNSGATLRNDFIELYNRGYGTGASGANCFEGAAAAPTLSNTTANLRGGAGSVDTDNNNLDFATGTPNPRNSTPPPPPPPVMTTIHDIQGSGSVSPFAGQAVTTEGIVTAR